MKASRGIHSFVPLFTANVLSLFIFMTPSYAQDATDSTTTLLEPSTTTAPPLLSLISELLLPHSTLYTTSFHIKPPPLPLYRTDTPTPTPDPSPHHTNVFNYYFLFLAALALLVIGLVWYFHLQRARQRHAQRVSGQHALARDLEGWAGARRSVGNGRRREEGLDEDGEAPPPYQGKSEVEMGTGEVVVPLGVVVRDRNGEVRPPGYSVDGRM
jgi:hypothetical protein